MGHKCKRNDNSKNENAGILRCAQNDTVKRGFVSF
jgi:hypothetical protein